MSPGLVIISPGIMADLYAARAGGCSHPAGLNTRIVEAGFFASLLAGRTGRGTNIPPQFGQIPLSLVSAHSAQKVHSNEQIIASSATGGRSLLQHSQFGRSSSISHLIGSWTVTSLVPSGNVASTWTSW